MGMRESVGSILLAALSALTDLSSDVHQLYQNRFVFMLSNNKLILKANSSLLAFKCILLCRVYLHAVWRAYLHPES